MRQLLRTWIADADTRRSLEEYNLQAEVAGLDYQDGRAFDLYLSLVGELFDLLRDAPEDARDWATLGNALSQAARALDGSARRDATFFSAAAFYSGGYSASAYVAMRQEPGDSWRVDT
jgi:ATP-dependent DNA helicase